MACRRHRERDSAVPATDAESKGLWELRLRSVSSLCDSSRMFGSVLLCYWSFSLLPLSSALVHGNIQLDDDRRTDSAYLSDMGRGHAPEPMHDPALLPVDSMEDPFLMDTGSYDEDSSAGVQLQGRAMRSSRRCIPHQQSCLGYPLPCCNPCDTCYCRFFNAICYCRRVGHACPPRRT